jgi:hypothetical protein
MTGTPPRPSDRAQAETGAASWTMGIDDLQARLGGHVARSLQAQPLPAGVPERLRVAREQALRHAGGGAAPTRSPTRRGWPIGPGGLAGAARARAWAALTGLAPLALLMGGLWAVHELHLREQLHGAAEIDALLLADDLPPQAWSDPGFAAFLRRAPGPERP